MVLLRLQFSGEWTANRRQSHHGKPQPAERTLIVAPACESYGKFHRHFKRSQKREKSVHCQRVKRIYKSMKWSTGGMCSSDSCTRPKWWTAKTNWELYYVIAATRERFNLQTSHRNCDEVFVRVQLHACGDKLPCGIAIAFQIDHHSTRTTFNCDIWFSWFSFSAEKINETACCSEATHGCDHNSSVASDGECMPRACRIRQCAASAILIHQNKFRHDTMKKRNNSSWAV